MRYILRLVALYFFHVHEIRTSREYPNRDVHPMAVQHVLQICSLLTKAGIKLRVGRHKALDQCRPANVCVYP